MDDLRSTIAEPELRFLEDPIDDQDAVGLPVVDQLKFLPRPDKEGRRLIDRGPRRQGDEGPRAVIEDGGRSPSRRPPSRLDPVPRVERTLRRRRLHIDRRKTRQWIGDRMP